MKAHDLRPRCYWVLGTLMGLAALFVPVQPAFAENVCPQANPGHVAQVSGATWLSRVTDLRRYPYSGGHRLIVTLHVEAVVAGSGIVAGKSLTIESGPCSVLAGLQEGARYLVSAEGVGVTASSWGIAFWRLNGDTASYVVMHPDAPVLDALRGATTVEQVIALVAPGGQLPPTDLARPPAPGGDSSPVLWARNVPGFGRRVAVHEAPSSAGDLNRA